MMLPSIVGEERRRVLAASGPAGDVLGVWLRAVRRLYCYKWMRKGFVKAKEALVDLLVFYEC